MKVSIEGVKNARDLGGLKTEDGKTVKLGRVLRAGHLSYLTENGKTSLQKLPLCAVVDLRTDAERELLPDERLDGVQYYHTPILRSLTVGVTREKKTEEEQIVQYALAMQNDPVGFMQELYEPLVTDEYSLTHYREFLTLLKNQKSGATLYHCTCGKDRAGVATFLFLWLLGVSKEDVLKDYLLTNDSMVELNRKMVCYCQEKKMAQSVIDTIPYVNGVDRGYLLGCFDFIEKNYQSKEDFFEKALRIDRAFIDEMKENYLE